MRKSRFRSKEIIRYTPKVILFQNGFLSLHRGLVPQFLLGLGERLVLHVLRRVKPFPNVRTLGVMSPAPSQLS